MSAFFSFQTTLIRLFNNCVKLYWCKISFSWNMKGESNWLLPPEKTTLKKFSFIRVKAPLQLFYLTGYQLSTWKPLWRRTPIPAYFLCHENLKWLVSSYFSMDDWIHFNVRPKPSFPWLPKQRQDVCFKCS